MTHTDKRRSMSVPSREQAMLHNFMSIVRGIGSPLRLNKACDLSPRFYLLFANDQYPIPKRECVV